uniref:Uncharacterized protein n=1 Tax=Rhipiliopsis peltata TaxID=2320810 RepID=A0A386B1B4_9CHLO|nr:hypothetical protein [Rhipiliopsis peltata]AYC65486.1 hypothetical protein [Rhipiliopsis peltata]
MAAYTSLDANEIKSNFSDLMNNTTGPATRASRLQMILDNPIKLRSHRRNIMLRTTGKIQSQPIYQPTLPYPDMANLSVDTLSEITPFEQDEFIQAKNHIIETLYPNDLNKIVWADGIKISKGKGENLTFIENDIFEKKMSRLDSPTLPETPSPSKIKNSLWKQAIASQIDNLKK